MRTITCIILTLLVFTCNSQRLNFLPQDSIYFENNTIPVYLDPSPGNIWQIGTPYKTWLNVAYSPPKAIVTDTLLPYPANNTSIFSFVIDSNSIWNNPIGAATYFSFIHKFDTDTLNDYGIIEASIDGGITWCDLGDPSCFEGYLSGPAWWEPDSSMTSHNLSVHPPKISGKSDGWIFSRFHFDYYVSKKTGSDHPVDSIMIRFTFISDANTSTHEGWMIDNIIIGACDIYVSAPTLEKPEYSINISPNPLIDRSVIKLPCGKFQNMDILIYDETGRKIRTISGKQGDIIPLLRKDFSPGIYLLKTILEGDKPAYGKFMVQ